MHLFIAILYMEKVVSFYLSFDLLVHCIWFFIQLYSYSTLDGEVFGQRRDQAELLDGTIITLSQEQLRKVLCYTKYNNYWSKKISHCWHLRMANNQFEFNLDVCFCFFAEIKWNRWNSLLPSVGRWVSYSPLTQLPVFVTCMLMPPL